MTKIYNSSLNITFQCINIILFEKRLMTFLPFCHMKVINVSLICQRSLSTFKDKFVKNQMLTLHDLFHAEVKF